MNNQLTLPWDAVSTHGRKVVTTSLKVAEIFGKQHKHVLRDIEAISQSKSGPSDTDHQPKSGPMIDPIAEFHRLNFELMTYLDEAGKGARREQPMYEMTKDGFTLLAMGYTGEKAMLFKIAYIAEFNRMAERLARNDYATAATAEKAYFQRYPVDRQIRQLALLGEPYWYIGRIVGRAAGTVSNAIRRMLHWGVMDATALKNARAGMTTWWRHRRKFANQLTLNL
ncbi:Rha family transcriptional regulator [Azonexus hydrophilus]|uniref:Rha family transcriptional regulator n=1 Tax=Azonexus hydrophilus TaxID=418702 RepID=UPI00248F8FEA|nr:Rha family transcriptional regulator [Azonexus hydrophilus]